MLPIALAARLFAPSNIPFGSLARDAKREVVRATYNDMSAEQGGFTETARAMIDMLPDGQARVCFSVDKLTATGGVSCHPRDVIWALATGLQKEYFGPRGIAPEKVQYYFYTPERKDTHGPWMDRRDEPHVLRAVPLGWQAGQYDIDKKADGPSLAMYLGRKVPKAIRHLPVTKAAQELDLRAYTPNTARQLSAATPA